jgi:hypothetical protein
MNRRSFLQAASALPLLQTGMQTGRAQSVAALKIAPRFGDGRDWWFEKRFGMFIHWGLYAIHGLHEQEQWRYRVPRAEYETRQTVEPGEIRSQRLARPCGRRGYEVRLPHHQAPRRLLSLGHEADHIQYDEHALRQGRGQDAGRRLPPPRRAALPLLFDRRLAPAQLPQSGPLPRVAAAGRRSARPRALPGVPQGAGARALHEITASSAASGGT